MTKLTNNDHPIHDHLRHRWSPRAFSSQPIEDSTLLSLFEAARWAPSCRNDQPWGFLVARREQVDEFARLLETLVEANRVWAQSAGALVLAVARSTFAADGKPNLYSWYDLGQAVAHLTTQATSQNLFVHQMAGILPERAREIFTIPEGWQVVTGIAIGYLGDPAQLPEPLRQREIAESTRKPLREFVFTCQWGQVFKGSVNESHSTEADGKQQKPYRW